MHLNFADNRGVKSKSENIKLKVDISNESLQFQSIIWYCNKPVIHDNTKILQQKVSKIHKTEELNIQLNRKQVDISYVIF